MFLRKKKSYEYVVKTAMDTLGISRPESEKRINALLKSGLLNGGHPGNKWTQMIIDNFLRFDSSVRDFQATLFETMNFDDLVREYDIINKTNLIDGSIDRTINLMKQDTVFRSRLTLSVNGLIDEFLNQKQN